MELQEFINRLSDYSDANVHLEIKSGDHGFEFHVSWFTGDSVKWREQKPGLITVDCVFNDCRSFVVRSLSEQSITEIADKNHLQCERWLTLKKQIRKQKLCED